MFTQAEIPDMSAYDPQSSYWLSNHVLNSIFRAAWKPLINAYIYNYLRRAEASFREHENARTTTVALLSPDNQTASKYAAALFHWETFLGQSWHAYKILEKLLKNVAGPRADEVKIFEKGDNSVEERLNKLYNQMKHVESRIATSGQILPGATIPVWITNEGLKSTDTLLSFSETGEVLRDLAKWAETLQDPLLVAEKLKNDTST